MKIEFFDKLPSYRATAAVAAFVAPVVNRDRLPRPFTMTFVVTRRCNSRCQMCHIWMDKTSPTLSLDDIRHMFRQPLPSVRALTLTGGEATLRADLPELFDITRAALPRLEYADVASHGMNTDRTLGFVERMLESITANPGRLREFVVQLSLDGIGEMHDQIRGINGFFTKVTRTLDGLQALRRRYPILNMRLSTVVMPTNLGHVRELRRFAAERGLKINFSPAVLSGAYYENLLNADELGFVAASERGRQAQEAFKQLAAEEPSSMRFYYGDMAGMLAGKPRGRTCMMGHYGFILEHDGEVYPCVNWEIESFGNLLHEDFDSIWFGERAHKARQELRSSGCPTCPASCYTLPTGPGELAQDVFAKATQKLARLRTSADERQLPEGI